MDQNISVWVPPVLADFLSFVSPVSGLYEIYYQIENLDLISLEEEEPEPEGQNKAGSVGPLVYLMD